MQTVITMHLRLVETHHAKAFLYGVDIKVPQVAIAELLCQDIYHAIAIGKALIVRLCVEEELKY
jgi:hypothetical protein